MLQHCSINILDEHHLTDFIYNLYVEKIAQYQSFKGLRKFLWSYHQGHCPFASRRRMSYSMRGKKTRIQAELGAWKDKSSHRAWGESGWPPCTVVDDERLLWNQRLHSNDAQAWWRIISTTPRKTRGWMGSLTTVGKGDQNMVTVLTHYPPNGTIWWRRYRSIMARIVFWCLIVQAIPDSKLRWPHVGPTWILSAPRWANMGPTCLVSWDYLDQWILDHWQDMMAKVSGGSRLWSAKLTIASSVSMKVDDRNRF